MRERKKGKQIKTHKGNGKKSMKKMGRRKEARKNRDEDGTAADTLTVMEKLNTYRGKEGDEAT